MLPQKIRSAARELLTLDKSDARRIFEGNALIRRLVRLGVLDEDKQDLNFCLNLSVRFHSRRPSRGLHSRRPLPARAVDFG
jgi:hypothetical protein